MTRKKESFYGIELSKNSKLFMKALSLFKKRGTITPKKSKLTLCAQSAIIIYKIYI